jgi:hypothetical protein
MVKESVNTMAMILFTQHASLVSLEKLAVLVGLYLKFVKTMD